MYGKEGDVGGERSMRSLGFLQRHHFALVALSAPLIPRPGLPGSVAINGSVISNSTAVARMGTGGGDRRDPSSNPKVTRLRELMASDAASSADIEKLKNKAKVAIAPALIASWKKTEEIQEQDDQGKACKGFNECRGLLAGPPLASTFTATSIVKNGKVKGRSERAGIYCCSEPSGSEYDPGFLLVYGGWEKSWEEGLTPWDLGQPTPVVQHLVQMGTLPKGRVLVPGCGNGYDVVAIASPERYVVGLEISHSAVKKAKEWSSSLPNANYFTFLVADFFTWQPTELFDLIFDYTFFCAIDPCMRAAWARKVRDLLKPDGELIALIYLISDQDKGPPYNVTVADYEKVLNPVGFKALSIVDNELAVAPRKGREKLGRWKRCISRSCL